MKHDVIIIGSGFGGLACAHMLAKAGRSVLVLEAHWQPGGCLQSYQRKGHTFDTGLHYVGGLDEGQQLHDVFQRLGLLRLPWHRLDAEGFDQITIGGHTYRFAEGFDRFVDVLAADFPHERKALQRYVEMLQGPDPDPSVSAWGWLNEVFSDALLIDVLSGSCLKTELRRESMPLLAFAHSQKSYIQSSWRLKGDSSLLVRALVDDIRQMGGEVVCRAEVVQLLEKDGRITAACCSNGETYEADRFISDIHPAQVLSLVQNERIQKGIYRRRLSMLENTVGMYTHSLVLKPGALPYFNCNHFVYRGGSVWDESTERVMLSCRVPVDDADDVTLLDLLTPSAADPMPLAETVIPGLRDMVSEQYDSTPQTWERFTHTPNGSAYGIRKDCRQPLLTMLSPRTSVPNLLLTGQNVMLHGLEGVAMTAVQTTEILLNE
ncbi:MAG: NAD(P)/FAD-dependent oxidoreductase [Prevotella sp.]|nr:NAD(P)/FAD-dependent oxidoreductase [Prevotella sp.]